MPRPIKIRIDVTKLLKEHFFSGKQRQDGSVPKYANLVAWPNKKPSQYGDSHSVQQELSKEARNQGVQQPYVGTLTMPDDAPQQSYGKPAQGRNYNLPELPDGAQAKKAASQQDGWEDDSSVPF